METYDLTIIGAGPAGTTLATLVAQSGFKVLILEKEDFPRYKIGESLLPATVRDLANMLDISQDAFKSEFVTKRGASFSWGSNLDKLWNLNFGGPRSEEPVLAPETPSAFNVSRDKFDQILLDNAVKNGVTVVHGCTATNFIEENSVITGVCYLDRQGHNQ
jgi:halogenation protein CepH